MAKLSMLIFCVIFINISISSQSDSTKSSLKADSTKNSSISDTGKTGTTKYRKPVIKMPKKSSRKWVQAVLNNQEKKAQADSLTASVKDTSKSPYEIAQADKKNAVQLLVMRPISKYGSSKLKDKWLLYLCEVYLHFKLTGIAALKIVSPDTLSILMHEYKVYTKAIPVTVYRETARRLSVPYILYLECKYLPGLKGGGLPFGNDVSILGKVSSVEGDDIAHFSTQCALKEFGTTLDQFAIHIVEKLGIPPEKQNREFLDMALMGTKKNSVKKLGNMLASEETVSRKEFQEFCKKYNTLMSKDQDMIVGYYAGVQFCVKREQYAPAADFSYALVHRLRGNYPRGYLMAAANYRRVGNYDQALRIIEQAESIESIRVALIREKTLCLIAKGKTKDTKRSGKNKR